MHMIKRLFPFCLVFLLAALPACGLSSILRKGTPTPLPPVEVTVSADQIAQAMQNDSFFSDYRGNVLIVTGKVRAVNQTGSDVQLELETSLPTKVICDLGPQAADVKTGDQITVQAKAGEAERALSAVLLKNCRIYERSNP